MTKKRWDWVGIGMLVVAVLTLALSTWDRLTTPSGDLHVTATASEFRLPPSIDSLLSGRAYPWGDFSLDGYITARVRNTGTKEIQKVSIRFPLAAYWCWTPSDRDPQCRRQHDSLSLGTLSGHDSGTVEIWSAPLRDNGAYRDLQAYHDGINVPVEIAGINLATSHRTEVIRNLLALLFALLLGVWLCRRVTRRTPLEIWSTGSEALRNHGAWPSRQ